jgi:hypothetical protein
MDLAWTWKGFLRSLTTSQSERRTALDNTQVSDAGLEHLTYLPNRQTLVLRNTEVTDHGVQKLQSALPSLTRWPSESIR